jgi:hypothetical protein
MVVLPSRVSAFFTAVRNLEPSEGNAYKRWKLTTTRFGVEVINRSAGRYYARNNIFVIVHTLNIAVG